MQPTLSTNSFASKSNKKVTTFFVSWLAHFAYLPTSNLKLVTIYFDFLSDYSVRHFVLLHRLLLLRLHQ